MYGIADGIADFKVFIYDTYQHYQSNQPYIVTTSGIYTGDTTFLVGNEVVSGNRMNYFQFGVEASTHIGEVDKWDIQNFKNAYYDPATNQWKYLPGYSIQGSKAYITYYGSEMYSVGGQDYTNVNKYLVAPEIAAVRWRYMGTTIGNDVLLWSTSGVVSPRPYE